MIESVNELAGLGASWVSSRLVIMARLDDSSLDTRVVGYHNQAVVVYNIVDHGVWLIARLLLEIHDDLAECRVVPLRVCDILKEGGRLVVQSDFNRIFVGRSGCSRADDVQSALSE